MNKSEVVRPSTLRSILLPLLSTLDGRFIESVVLIRHCSEPGEGFAGPKESLHGG
jgi:hypothetical protein